METMNYRSLFSSLKQSAYRGNVHDIDHIMNELDQGDLPVSRAVDLYLGSVSNAAGIERLTYYLFSGSQIQRNYSALFFARRNDWSLINRAYAEGCIDEIQAYSR